MFSQVIRDDDIVITGGYRTPTGRLLGQLSNYSASDLGSICLRELDEFIDPQDVDELIVGSVLQGGQGQAPARQVLVNADWSPAIPAVTINKVCGSGLKAVLQATESILGGPGQVRVAGGMESMTNAPHLLPDYRGGNTLGHGQIKDSAVSDGLWCAVEDEHMGSAAERIASRYDLSRDELDEFALRSHENASEAEEKGYFEEERITFDDVQSDEPVRSDTSLEKLGSLSPAFQEDGVVTAGNAPGLNDGAAFLVVSDRNTAERGPHSGSVFRIEGYSVVGDEPGNLFETPASAIELLLEGTDWSLEDFDRIEINEAFASQVLANCHRLELNPDRVNKWGGAIALGHPIGMSGARILLTLITQMRYADEERGLAAICMGGGNGIALAVRQVSL